MKTNVAIKKGHQKKERQGLQSAKQQIRLMETDIGSFPPFVIPNININDLQIHLLASEIKMLLELILQVDFSINPAIAISKLWLHIIKVQIESLHNQ